MLAMFVVTIWALTLYAGGVVRGDMQRLLGEQQFSTVSIVAAQINGEVESRLQALERYAKGRITPDLAANAAAVQQRLEQSPTLQSMFNAGLFVTDASGTAIASIPVSAQRVGVNYMERDHVAAALKEAKTRVSEPVIGKKLRAPVVSMAAPIRDSQGKVVGSVVGVTDLSKPNFLDKVTQNRYGKAGGYIIAAPKYRLIVTATDKTRIMTAFPAPGVNRLFDRYMQGFEGSGSVVDAGGVAVLSAAKQVPAAGWVLVVRIPSEEVFTPLREIQRRVLLASLILTLLVGALIWWLLRRQFSPMLAAANTLANLSGSHLNPHPLLITSHDEIGELIGSFNGLLETLVQREDNLKESERLLKESQNIAGLGSYVLDIATGLWTSSEVLDRLFGIDASYIRSVPGWEALIHPDDRAMMDRYFREQVIGQRQIFDKDYRIVRCGDQAERWVHGLGKLEFDSEGRPLTMHGTIQDITERKQAESEIQNLAFSDPLTGLPNRRLLMDRLEQAQAATFRNGQQDALMFIDLDYFKTLNDTLGHDKGDSLLKQIAQRLTACVRDVDTIARLGGDEFVVLLQELSSSRLEAARYAQNVAAKVLAVLGQPYDIDGHGHHSTASIGVTLFGGAERESAEEPVKRAELAMYEAKAAGRNTLRFFRPEMETAVTNRATLEAELREAVASGQFFLEYQPQAAYDFRLSGAEALLRWQHPERGLVAPAEFIPIVEADGLILPLGRWVLETACKQLAAWAARPEMSHLVMAVNVSARQFRQPDFVEEVATILHANGAKPERLRLELTESVLVDNVEDVIVKMNALRAMGVGFSLDDFGTGYSSLSYLKRLPLDELKIDQGFVRDILTDPDDAAIAKMVVALADSLGLSVIAEGVETEAQRAFLAGLGCHNYQGYLFSRPLPIDEFEAFAEKKA